ncbi:MAG: hypothetical protein Q8M76_02860 [Spirochaetaceae bacterium]|nr:hypothetical protein [Spirochaetaceae bacterium]
MRRLFVLLVLAAVSALQLFAQTQALTADQKTKVEAYLKEYKVFGSDPIVVKAVKDFNAAPPAETKGMTQDVWAALSVLSPEVKGLAKNTLAEYLKTKRTAVIAELFVSGANGAKVAFFAKTTSWSHAGKPKHDTPMTGKSWTGAPELDESSGKVTVQISFPVLDGTKPIGSLVVGLDVSKL